MKLIVIAIFASIVSFIFLHKPLAKACGGSIKLWACLVFDLCVGVGVYLLIK